MQCSDCQAVMLQLLAALPDWPLMHSTPTGVGKYCNGLNGPNGDTAMAVDIPNDNAATAV